MELHIKNMVCRRCVIVIREELVKLGLHPVEIELGIVKLEEEEIDADKRSELIEVLNELGFELLDSTRTKLIEQIKNTIINRIFHEDDLTEKINWSKIIADHSFHEYNYLSTLFSSVEGITIEQYIIRQKIEKVKELIFYDELTLSEIANNLGYSSIAHLSAQFKKITGQTPSQFKKIRSKRQPIDSVIKG